MTAVPGGVFLVPGISTDAEADRTVCSAAGPAGADRPREMTQVPGTGRLILAVFPPQPAAKPVQSGEPYDGTPLLGHTDFSLALTQQAMSWR